MGKAEFYTKIIGLCMVKTPDGLVFNKSLVKDEFQLQIATTQIDNMLKSGELEEAQFNQMLNSFAKEQRCPQP